MLSHSNYSRNLMYSTPRYSTNGTLALIMVIRQWLQHSNVSINIFLFKINVLDERCRKNLTKNFICDLFLRIWFLIFSIFTENPLLSIWQLFNLKIKHHHFSTTVACLNNTDVQLCICCCCYTSFSCGLQREPLCKCN